MPARDAGLALLSSSRPHSSPLPARHSFAWLGRDTLLVFRQQLLQADCGPTSGSSQLRFDRAVGIVDNAADQSEAVHLSGKGKRTGTQTQAQQLGGQTGKVGDRSTRPHRHQTLRHADVARAPSDAAAVTSLVPPQACGLSSCPVVRTCRPSWVRPGFGRNATPASSANCSTSCTEDRIVEREHGGMSGAWNYATTPFMSQGGHSMGIPSRLGIRVEAPMRPTPPAPPSRLFQPGCPQDTAPTRRTCRSVRSDAS